jgi:hypothetical protein
MKESSSLLILFGALAASSLALSQGRPPLVNFGSTPKSDTDDLVIQHFGANYAVANITASDATHSIKLPSGTSGFGFIGQASVAGRCVAGTVVVAYIIRADGHVIEPFVVSSSDPRLNDIATARMRKVHFISAELDGKRVSSIAATRLPFACGQLHGS